VASAMASLTNENRCDTSRSSEPCLLSFAIATVLVSASSSVVDPLRMRALSVTLPVQLSRPLVARPQRGNVLGSRPIEYAR